MSPAAPREPCRAGRGRRRQPTADLPRELRGRRADDRFRTDEGTKLDAAVSGFGAAFEIDGTDAMCQTGWSVLVSGSARRVVDAHEVAALGELHLRPWVPGEKAHWVRLRPDTITGRRIITFDG